MAGVDFAAGNNYQSYMGNLMLSVAMAALAVALPYVMSGETARLFEGIIVDGNAPVDPWLKAAGDLNGDGKIDLIAGGATKGGLVWYQNPGWKKHVISTEPGFSTDGEVADIDKDGDNDLIVVRKAGWVQWIENPGWVVHPIADILVHDVEVVDLDGDGDHDLVARNQGAFGGQGKTLYFLRQDSPEKWSQRTIEIPNGEGLAMADLDRDGDADVVIERYWFENPGQVLREWVRHEYGTNWSHPHTFIATGDINGDGRRDIVVSPAELAGQRYRISWFEAPAAPKGSGWAEHVIEDDVEAVHHFIGVADFNRDGRNDIATAEMHQGEDPDEVRVYFNEGGKWRREVIDTGGSHSMRIVDVDGDGDSDLFGGNHQGQSLRLWKWKGVNARGTR